MHEFGFNTPMKLLRRWDGQHGRVGAKCGLHPLIHTLLDFNLAQNAVAVSKWQKCGLKYVIHTTRARMEHKKAEPKLRSILWGMNSEITQRRGALTLLIYGLSVVLFPRSFSLKAVCSDPQ